MNEAISQPRTTVNVSELIHRIVDKSYEDFRSLLLQLPTMREEDRRDPLLSHLHDTRKRMAQLLVILKWSIQAPLIEKCTTLLDTATTYRNQTNETNDRLFFMHADLSRAKERCYDLSTAIDVLYGGTYMRLPTIMKRAMLPRELPPIDIADATREIEDLIRYRLIDADIPEQFTKVTVEGGFVTCVVDGEFEIVLTIHDRSDKNSWRIVSVNTVLSADPTDFTNRTKKTPTSSLRIIKTNIPTQAHYHHLKNLAQRAISKSEKPFVEAFNVMREFCSALALQIVAAQGKLLMEGRWKGLVHMKFNRPANVLDMCYWPNSCLTKAKETVPERTMDHSIVPSAALQDANAPEFPTSSLCIRLSIDPLKKKLLSTTLCPSLPPNFPMAHHLLGQLKVESSLFDLSAEKILISGMRAHAAAALFSLGKLLVVETTNLPNTPTPNTRDENDEKELDKNTFLVTGENVKMSNSESQLRIGRSDIGGLTEFLEITVDIREGQFKVNCSALAPNSTAATAVVLLERSLNKNCKIEVGHGSTLKNKTVQPSIFALTSGGESQTDLASTTRSQGVDLNSQEDPNGIYSCMRKALCEVVAQEIMSIGASFYGVEVLRKLPLNWERYLLHKQTQAAQTGVALEDYSISESAVYFLLSISKDSTCYLVIEIDKHSAIPNTLTRKVPLDDVSHMSTYIRLPCFSLLQTSTAVLPGQAPSVQFIQKFPAFRRDDLHPSTFLRQITRRSIPGITSNRRKKRRLGVHSEMSSKVLFTKQKKDNEVIQMKSFDKEFKIKNDENAELLADLLKRKVKSQDIDQAWSSNGTHDYGSTRNGIQPDVGESNYNDSSQLLPNITAILLHVINLCHDRLQLQHFVNFGKRRSSRIRYSGEAATDNRLGVGTGAQMLTLSFPERLNADPLKIVAIHVHLEPSGATEICLQLSQQPFTYIAEVHEPKPSELATKTSHYVNHKGHWIFCFPPLSSGTALIPLGMLAGGSSTSSNGVSGISADYGSENPLETFVIELMCVVKPFCVLAMKFEKILRPLGRYTSQLQDDGKFYVTSINPFSMVLKCCTKDPRRYIASGSKLTGKVTYQLTIQFKQKFGFVLSYSHKAEHPLIHFIQNSLNGHGDAGQLLEALERTCIPLGILASVVESQLLCTKYYRHDDRIIQSSSSSGNNTAISKNSANGIPNSGFGKKGGKGMRLGYKCKLPGEEKGYYAEKSYGGDDKSFIPAELTLIPRSQTHVRLAYGNRCAVDIYFISNTAVKLQSSSGGMRVPSCPSDRGIVVEFPQLAEKLQNVLSEMASV